ncbi:hypothetical protein LX36DRAFT_352282 [Colletotrichum falcatum]|nr:hypothetical protein LX36DRAFT_352282 [Colletotrichum falcatum]
MGSITDSGGGRRELAEESRDPLPPEASPDKEAAHRTSRIQVGQPQLPSILLYPRQLYTDHPADWKLQKILFCTSAAVAYPSTCMHARTKDPSRQSERPIEQVRQPYRTADSGQRNSSWQQTVTDRSRRRQSTHGPLNRLRTLSVYPANKLCATGTGVSE